MGHVLGRKNVACFSNFFMNTNLKRVVWISFFFGVHFHQNNATPHFTSITAECFKSFVDQETKMVVYFFHNLVQVQSGQIENICRHQFSYLTTAFQLDVVSRLCRSSFFTSFEFYM